MAYNPKDYFFHKAKSENYAARSVFKIQEIDERFRIFKPGYKTLISQVYDPADPNIESDAQFGVTRALIGKFVRHEEPHPSARDVATPWYSLDHTYRMETGEAVLPRAPIK